MSKPYMKNRIFFPEWLERLFSMEIFLLPVVIFSV